MFVLRKKREFVESFQSTTNGKANPLWTGFVTAFFESAPAQSLQNPNDKNLLQQIKNAWEFYQKKEPEKLAIQYDQIESTNKVILNIFQPDQPFILETLKSVFKGLPIKHEVIYHPVFKAKRSKNGTLLKLSSREESIGSQDYHYESLINVELDLPETFSSQNIQDLIEDVKWRMSLIQLSVMDWPKIRQRMQKMIPKKQHPEWDFFEWLCQDNFLFLGMRVVLANGKKMVSLPTTEGALGIFRDEKIMRHRDFFLKVFKADKKNFFYLEKTNYRSPINRPARIDMIEVPIKDTNEVCQIIGIFTRRSYTESAFRIPLIKAKATRVFDSFSIKKSWHDGKILSKALESIPHDEYWHFSEDTLRELCAKIIGFHDHSLPVFAYQQSQRSTSTTVIVFLGRERYSPELREKMGEEFAKALGGDLTSTRGIIDDAPFSRFIFAIDHAHIPKELEELQKIIELMSLTWEEKRCQLQGFLNRHDPFHRFFDQEYQKDFVPEQAVVDCALIEQITDSRPFTLNLALHQLARRDLFNCNLTLRVMSKGTPIVLSHLMEVLQNFGITIVQEKTYPIHQGNYYLHVCHGNLENVRLMDASHKMHICQIIEKTLRQDNPNDSFNGLFTTAQFNKHQVTVMRALGEYAIQAQYPYAYSFISQTLNQFPTIAALLIRFFEEKFLPNANQRKREITLKSLTQEFLAELDMVNSSDQDQLLRDIKSFIDAMVRTNYYLNRDYLSFKFDSQQIPHLQDPKPLFETFVSSSLMQGIHLRTSRVARGGIRYSDRANDFRMEILQLMQAQHLKNALIVPTGAKGGFIVKKKSPSSGEVVESYKTLIRGLLDITDNRENGLISRHQDLVCFDMDDPYLVVAADKGTASFSDIANSLASEYNFWLGDAFASGGSHGYDHKKLGITAKGAFVSIEHHFKKLGRDLNKNSIRIVGVGDMSGDVFGNGMVLHDTIKLIGAFNHKYIFIDPDPDCKASFNERKRLFESPSLSWADYNPRALSKGGGIYDRSKKLIMLSSQAQKLLNLPEMSTPKQIIQSLLCANIDLLYFGGIGTFIRASDELYTADATNDPIRVTASDIQAQVIGEGANLGVTPLARIELAMKGILLNSDAIDNVGGANCSDHEVNLKILLRDLPTERRNKILEKITPDVIQNILLGNKKQNQALDLMEAQAREYHQEYCDLILKLEKMTPFKRNAVYLEKDDILRKQRSYLTRPELGVILSYTKIALKKHFLENFELISAHGKEYLTRYFPEAITKDYPSLETKHLLTRDIIVLSYVNTLVDGKGALTAFNETILG